MDSLKVQPLMIVPYNYGLAFEMVFARSSGDDMSNEVPLPEDLRSKDKSFSSPVFKEWSTRVRVS
jgi:hypothetical protein